MPKVLILAEKPSQARDYAKAFRNCKEKKGYIDCGEVLITWAYGHLFEIDDAIAPRALNLTPSEALRRLFLENPHWGNEWKKGRRSRRGRLNRKNEKGFCEDKRKDGVLQSLPSYYF